MDNLKFFEGFDFYKETEFKDTEIGKIPKEWDIGNANLFGILKGYAFRSIFFSIDKKGIPLIRIRDLGKKETECYYIGPYESVYLVKKGDILISMDGEFNVYLWDGPIGLLNQRICKILSKDQKRLNNLFLYYVLQKPIKIIEMQISQTTVKHLLDRDLNRINFPLPPLPEQEKIAEILSIIDKAIELTDKIIKSTERLKKGFMNKLLTEGVNIFALEKDKIINAIEKCLKNGFEFGMDENLNHHLARYLKEEFPDYDIDIVDEHNGSRPDIIIHKRNTEHNLFAIEVKKHTSIDDIKRDIEKLENIVLNDNKYCEVIFIGFDVDEKVLELSDNVNFLLVNRDGYKVKFRNREFKDTEIGKIPKEWEVKRLKDVCIKITDGSHWSPKEVEKSDYRIATVANLNETYIDIDSCKFISKEDYLRLLKEGDVPERGDVLFSKDGTVGISFTFKQDNYNIGLLSSIAIIRPNLQILFSDFIPYTLKSSRIFWQIIEKKTGTALRRIILDHIKTVKIPIPPLPEQEKIADILSTIDDKLEIERKERERLEKVKKVLMDLLLTGKIRVRV